MPSTGTLLAFSAATLLLLVIPGPAVMYIVARSASQGRRAGLVSVAGIHVGTIVHVVAAMVGLSAVLAASATAFTAVQLAGAAYLLWLGIGAFRAARATGWTGATPTMATRGMRRVFVDGVIVNVLNPKTAIFFLSYVPLFVDPDAAHPVAAVAVLGALFIALGLASDGAYAMAGGWVGSRLTDSPTLQRRRHLVAGVAYLGLGVATAFGGHRSS